MKCQTHISPDNLITLISEPTQTINAEHPEGFEDWIISLSPGDWHTHPDPNDPIASMNKLIRDVIEDRAVLQVWYKNNQIDEICILDSGLDTVESENARLQLNPIPNYSIVHRLWSGQILS